MPVASWSPAEWTDFLNALTGFAWPAAFLIAVVLFREQLRELLRRTEEIDTPAGKLRAPIDPGPVEQVKRQLHVGSDPSADDREAGNADREADGTSSALQLTDEILDLATRDPRVAFLRLLDALEDRVRDLAAAWGGQDPYTPRWQDLLDGLVTSGVIPRGVASNVTLLDEIRNRAIHYPSTDWEDDALTALTGGLDLLIALDSIPVQGYEVIETGVPLYRDADLTTPWPDATGVMVRQRKPRGRTGEAQGPFPTRKSYEQGDIVGWQWSFNEPAREFYWQSPSGRSNLIRSAWFVGDRLRRPSAT